MPFDGNHLAGSLTMSEHSWTFPTSVLNRVSNEDGYNKVESIILMEIPLWDFPAGQLHPKLSPLVMFTWRNRDVQSVLQYPGKAQNSLHTICFLWVGKKQPTNQKPRKSILITWFLDSKRINANQFLLSYLLLDNLKPITYSVY